MEKMISIQLTSDEARHLYKAYVNGIHGGDARIINAVTVKVERAKAIADGIVALRGSMDIEEAARGKEKVRH
jgi:hypothetical protein